jgi:GT2 family glycosyltransferase
LKSGVPQSENSCAAAEVTAVIPTWNRRDLLARLLDRLQAQTLAPAAVVVVDNGSQDGADLEAERQGARVIRMGYNAGFSRAVNRGVEVSRTRWVAILNNDVMPEQDWLERLVSSIVAAPDGTEVWFACGKVLQARAPDRIDATFDVISRGGTAWRAGHGRQNGPPWDEPRWIQMPPLTAALVRRDLFAQVGWLDEAFESYLEDVEFGLRCALAACHGLYEPKAIALHEGSGTLGAWHPDTVRRIARNQALLVAKHYPRVWGLRYGWPVLVAQVLWGGLAIRHGQGLPYLKGKLQAVQQWRRLRREAASRREVNAGRLAGFLEASEKNLIELQHLTGFDLYWRLYSALT